MIRDECAGKTVLIVTHSEVVKGQCTNIVNLEGNFACDMRAGDIIILM